MNKLRYMTLTSIICLFLCSCAPAENDSNIILLKTTLGDIKIMLYDDTPVHKENFKLLVKNGVYDDVTFHRVINNFMVQTGDPTTKSKGYTDKLDTLKTYTLPSEFRKNHYHKKGAVAAARQGNNVNPYMRSSGTQFYIVQGTKLSDKQLDEYTNIVSNNIVRSTYNMYIQEVIDSAKIKNIELSPSEIQDKASTKMFNYLSSNNNYEITEEMRETYKTTGGYPGLDGTYTVFGEVTEGLDIIDKIAAAKTDNNDKPISDIRIIKAKIITK